MFSRYNYLKLLLCIFSIFFIISCGKVVQQTTDNVSNANVFLLNYKTNQIYFNPVEFNSTILTSANKVLLPQLKGADYEKFSNNDVWINAFYKNKKLLEVIVKDDLYYSSLISSDLVRSVTKNIGHSSFVFKNNKPIYSLIRGYRKQKVYELAWGYCLIEKTPLKNQIKPNNPIKLLVNKKYSYKADFYDKDKIKVTNPKRTQISGNLVKNSNELNFSSKDVSRDYDYYLVALYSNEKDFQFKMLSNKIVSKNKIVNLDTISALDTFRSLIFIEAFRNNALDIDIYNGLHQLYDQQFFNSLNYTFKNFDLKLFNSKKPQFKYSDKLISECVFILELAFIDITEAINHIKLNEKQLFTKQQQDLLISSINSLKLAKVE